MQKIVALWVVPSVKLFCPKSKKYSTIKLSDHQDKQMRKGLPTRAPIAGVSKVILIASGKGGVGKSTIAVNLALALSKLKPPNAKSTLQVGLLDADIYGPSIPKLMNLEGDEPMVNDNGLIVPITNYGIKVMSMGFLTPNRDDAIVWRGLMVMSAIQKLLRQVDWSPLDVLVIDMPPGTGDVQLSISQNIPVDGAIVISTPQQVALIDAQKGAQMFTKVQVPLLGFVENMSQFICPCCNQRSVIFSSTGQLSLKSLADKYACQVLASIPLQQDICDTSDNGQPIVIAHPQSPISQNFLAMGQKLLSLIYPTL